MADQVPRMMIQSVRVSGERSRPFSARLHKHQDKIYLLHRAYDNIPGPPDRSNFGRNYSFHTPAKNIKSKEPKLQKQALIEQNTMLKKKVNMLETHISQLNGKMIVAKTKTSKINKILDIEFQNQTLWPGKSSYLVTGVKNQYEKLQAQYKEKCEQLTRMKQTLEYTKLQQMDEQYQNLQTCSKSLLMKNLQLEKRIDALSRPSLSGLAFSQRNYQTVDMRIEELREQEISQLKLQIKLQQKRAKFSEKLAIEKNNEVHSLSKINKKLKNQKQENAKEILSLREKIGLINMQNDVKITSIIEADERKANQQREIYNKVIKQKDTCIEQLEKSVAYLTTLISYWKPLDGQRRQNQPSTKKTTIIEVEKKADEDKSRKASTLNEGQMMSSRILSQRQAQVVIKPQTKPQIQAVDKPRQQKRVDIKRSNSSKKVRQVRSSQVQQICQLLQFRLIAKRVSIDSAKSYFSSGQIKNMQLIKDDNQQPIIPWQCKYITMRQTYDILMSEPFNLSQTQAQLLSRYLIEDLQNDYIYCAWDNQNSREVVKSILRNTLKDYDIKGSLEEIQAETKVELDKYKSRISVRLQQECKDGFISKKKLVQVIGGELSQPVMEFIIGKLAAQAQSLDKLDYTLVF